MSANPCPKCGATRVAPDAPCRRCLIELAANWQPKEEEPLAVGETGATRAPRPGTPPPTPAELAPLFAELEIEALLGVGGMGAVYRARQRRLGRTVALKVLHGELSGDALFVERFLREAQALAKLAHPGIVTVHDFGEREGRCYLVMEYVDGANLRVLLKQKQLAPRQALDIVRQLCDALQFAHDEGVVHRDIKPENVLVDPTGRVKIADFGLAKLIGGQPSVTLTSAGQVMGTPHYMAPEQVERPRDVDHRADLFSLGVVFYEMLTGELPLGRFAPPSERVQIDVRLDEIVLKSLERERERRYQHAAQVKTDVETVEREPAKPAEPQDAEKKRLTLEGPLRIEGAKMLFGFRMARRGKTGKTFPMFEVHGSFAWLLAFAATWWGVAGAFNGGSAVILSIVLAVLAALLYGHHAERRSPEARATWRARTKGQRFGRGLASVLLMAAGLMGLFAAHVASWEKRTTEYAAPPSDPDAMLAAARRVAEHGAGAGDGARVDVSDVFAQTDPYRLGGLPPLLVAAASVLLLALALLVLDTIRAHEDGGRVWRSAAQTLSIALLPLLGWDAAQNFRMPRAVHPLGTQSVEVDEPSSEVASRLYAAMLEEGYAVQTQIFLGPPRGIPDLELRPPAAAQTGESWGGQLLRAAPASPLERWHLGWAGPERTRPAVCWMVLEPKPGRSRVVGLLGAVSSTFPRSTLWNARFELLAGRVTQVPH